MIEFEDEESETSLQDAMTPMIDVIFVLIAFMMLMINAPLLTMEVNLPKTVETPKTASLHQQVVTITVPADVKQWFINDEPATSNDELKAMLAAKKQEYGAELSVVVDSDKQVEMERIVQLFATLQKLELNVTHLALKQ